MMRNDYRRALILLRGNAPGYSGHVRLERRTLMGSMYFQVQAPDSGRLLQAVLVSRTRDSYDACVLGNLIWDSRGQAVLSYNFDPRDVCGKELEQYQLITVAYADGNDCAIVLYGNVCGHADLNWERVTQAVCLSLNVGTVEPVPPPVPAPRPPVNPPAQPDTPNLPTPELPPQENPAQPDTPNLPTPELPPQENPAQPDTPNLPTPELPPGIPTPIQPRTVEAASQPRRTTAGEELGVDLSLPWPDAVEGLRRLFASRELLADAPGNGYVYVEAKLPEGSPYTSLAAGIRAANGAPAAVSYAIPSVYTAEPPAGLEQYSWFGDGNRGWWVIEVPLQV